MSADFEKRSIEDIEGVAWSDPFDYETDLVRKCHLLRKKPLGALTQAELGLMIRQGIGTEVLVPRAIAILQIDPLVEARFYEGDLLDSVIKVSVEYWTTHPEQTESAKGITRRAVTMLREEEAEDAVTDLESQIHRFWDRLSEVAGG